MSFGGVRRIAAAIALAGISTVSAGALTPTGPINSVPSELAAIPHFSAARVAAAAPLELTAQQQYCGGPGELLLCPGHIPPSRSGSKAIPAPVAMPHSEQGLGVVPPSQGSGPGSGRPSATPIAHPVAPEGPTPVLARPGPANARSPISIPQGPTSCDPQVIGWVCPGFTGSVGPIFSPPPQPVRVVMPGPASSTRTPHQQPPQDHEHCPQPSPGLCGNYYDWWLRNHPHFGPPPTSPAEPIDTARIHTPGPQAGSVGVGGSGNQYSLASDDLDELIERYERELADLFEQTHPVPPTRYSDSQMNGVLQQPETRIRVNAPTLDDRVRAEIAVLQHDFQVAERAGWHDRAQIRRAWSAILQTQGWDAYQEARTQDDERGQLALLKALLELGMHFGADGVLHLPK